MNATTNTAPTTSNHPADEGCDHCDPTNAPHAYRGDESGDWGDPDARYDAIKAGDFDPYAETHDAGARW